MSIKQDPEMSFSAEIVRKRTVEWRSDGKGRMIGTMRFDGEEVGKFTVDKDSLLHKKVVFWLKYNGIFPEDAERSPDDPRSA